MSTAMLASAGVGRRHDHFAAVDVVLIELDAGEMTGGFSRLLHPVRGTLDRARARALRGHDLIQQAAPVKGLGCWERKSTQAERQLFQRRMRIVRLLQHQHRETGEPQLAREKQADGAGTGDDDVVKIRGLDCA